MKLSFTCIGRNEKEHIKELLPQLMAWGDEVIYVDCESEDGSYEEAEKMGCKVFRRENNRNLNVNKSFAMEQASGEWIFYVDPDERFSEALLKEVKNKIEQSDCNAFKLCRKNHFFGKWLQHGGQYPDKQLRLFKKGYGSFANKHVHESLNIQGRIGLLDEPMEHYPYLSVSQFLKKFDFYSGFEADYLYEQGVRPSWKNHIKYLWWKPETRFLRRYFLKGGFRDGIPGLFAALFDAAGWITRYVKLWERVKRSSLKSPFKKKDQ